MFFFEYMCAELGGGGGVCDWGRGVDEMKTTYDYIAEMNNTNLRNYINPVWNTNLRKSQELHSSI